MLRKKPLRDLDSFSVGYSSADKVEENTNIRVEKWPLIFQEHALAHWASRLFYYDFFSLSFSTYFSLSLFFLRKTVCRSSAVLPCGIRQEHAGGG